MTFRLPTLLKLLLVSLVLSVIGWSDAPATTVEEGAYGLLKKQGESYVQEGSYAKAHEVYLKAQELNLSPPDQRWVDFRVSDTQWRSQAETNNPDPSKLEQARGQLQKMIRDQVRTEQQDRLWVEIQESLGDSWWFPRNARNWSAAWRHYQNALDWWGGAADIDLARKRYLSIIWNAATPPNREPYFYYGYYGNYIPIEFLENALKIAQNKTDRVHAHYLIAMALRQQGNVYQQQRVPESFEAVIKAGKSSEWYDDALYYYAEWLSGSGEIIIMENGQQRREPNYKKALKYYRRILNDFKKGETRHYDNALNNVKNITRSTLNLNASSFFLPDSLIQVNLDWRNIEKVQLSLYRVNLAKDVDFKNKDSSHDWLKRVNLFKDKKVESWHEDLENKKEYYPGSKVLELDKKLPPGAYILEASGGGEKAREIILVTESSLVLKTSGKQALVYFADSANGAPLAKARVHLHERHYTGRKWVWDDRTATTDKDGLAVFDLEGDRHNSELFIGAALQDRQAFVTGYNHRYYSERDSWKLYVATDRPAYRPNETAQWKLTARTYDDSVYQTPANATLEYEITDPRGSKLKKGNLKLNEFGSAWDSLELSEDIPLGEYRITFWTQGRKKYIGNAALFRLEEYKLPEFKVSVQTPEKNGKKETFQLGDEVEVDIRAEYYFGGPVANANVEVVVYQRPFYHSWHPQPEFPWYYEDMISKPGHYWGQGQQVKREVIKTDEEGHARLTFQTARQNQDLQYTIEARVTDQSRREVISRGTVQVTRQPYYVYLNNEHNLYRPQDKVRVNIKALDANNQPVQTEGTVHVTRDIWYEIWIDPNGKEVQGQALEHLRREHAIFPPPPAQPGGPGWQLKFKGYRHDDILTRTIKTDTQGEAELTFTPALQGYYRIAWTSQRNKKSLPVKGETTVWVADDATTELGYRHGGLEIIVDKDTFRAGQTAPVMLVAPTSDRYVLFSLEGDDLYSYQLVHLTGTVKLIQLDIGEKHVPNVFLNGVMVSDHQIFSDSKQVVVPPVKNFLDVSVKLDRDQYQPREEGLLTVSTRNHKGEPVSAEVAVGLVDEAVYYIQQDLAPDPRQFFYGQKRSQHIQTQSSFQMKRLALLEKRQDGILGGERLGEKGDYGEMDSLGGAVQYKARAKKSLSANAPMPASEMLAEESFADDKEGFSKREMKAQKPGPGQAEPAVQVRSDFRSTILWKPNVKTGKDGTAMVKVKFADSLTQWRATARAVTTTNQFGIATANVRTQNPLIVRLQAPRFFVVGDQLTLSAIINNNTDEEMIVRPSLDAQGLINLGYVDRSGKAVKGEIGPTKVSAHGERRIDWLVAVAQAGHAKIRVTAKSSKHGDAMEKDFVIHEHGIEKFLSASGKMHGDEVSIQLDIPKERKKNSTLLSVQVTPSLAVTMLDALPYLIDYPYGCTEQTLSRFLPAVIVAKTLMDQGLQAESIKDKVFGGIETQHTGATHPKGKRNIAELDAMTLQGLERLYDFQHSDGGWGWWKKGDSDHFMTAYVLWGLSLAQQSGIKVDRNVLERAYRFLNKELVESEEQYDLQAWMLHALSTYHSLAKLTRINEFQSRAFANLWKNKSRLNAYTRSLLALSAHHYGDRERARTLIENLENGVIFDKSPDTSIIQRGSKQSQEGVMATAHWGEDGIFYRWSNGGVEATAFALRALLTIDPKNKLVEPVMNWLIKNRRGSNWSNTRDTAIVVLAMNDYLKTSGELEGGIEYELQVNGNTITRQKVEDVLRAPSRFVIDPKWIKDGTNSIRLIRKNGEGSLYFSANAQFFSLEEPIPAAGSEIFVRREYFKLVGRPTLLKGYIYDRIPLNDGDTVTSGERIETVLTIETKNHYEYLVFEDLKPAGLEAVQIQSGELLFAQELKQSAVDQKFKQSSSLVPPQGKSSPEGLRSSISIPGPVPDAPNSDYTGRTRWVYQELRDRKVALFVDKLPQGVWQIRYTLRAEVPGRFHALPVMGHAMYIPEIRANGAEIGIRVSDKTGE
ncbi:MAG: MG2 domain-containing protein [Nitrospinota bacterium]|nr:MG2 domain-containing protein [Nitrospinota bacterium]